MKPEPPRPNAQDKTVALLSRPDTYGVDAVELVETHISRVFLANDRAYKLKKAVRFATLTIPRQSCASPPAARNWRSTGASRPAFTSMSHLSRSAQTALWRWAARAPRRTGSSSCAASTRRRSSTAWPSVAS